MLILSLDTTTRAGSGAVTRDGVVLCEEPSDPARDHATQLPGTVAALIHNAGVALGEIDAFAVATGPGSFTGLRIGIAAMQALAVARNRPLIGISALDALAMQVPKGRVATWMDAWRGEVYASLYEDGREVEPAVVAHPEQLVTRLGGVKTTFIGDGVSLYRDLVAQRLRTDAEFADPLVPLLAGAIAKLGSKMALAGHLPSPDDIRPLYVRRTDADLSRDGEQRRQDGAGDAGRRPPTAD
jgi:tRNA threonylcarbamoyladenosine biosynthesis protein TsaB